IFLLDRDGRTLAAADDDPNAAVVAEIGQPPMIVRASQSWGHFEEPIRGGVMTAGGSQQAALARGFFARDGYLLIAHTPSERIDPVGLKGAMWAAGGITLLWTL